MIASLLQDKPLSIAKAKRNKLTAIKPKNLPERLIWLYIIYNIPIYYLGLQFALSPLLAYFLTGYLIFKWWFQTETTPPRDRIRISLAAWIWISSVLVIAVALFVGCLNFDLSFERILNSFMNRWLRTWALFAFFPVVGHLNIRPQIIFRAACILCIQMLILLVIASSVILFNIGAIGYVSPFSFLGGGTTYYTVYVFGVINDVGSLRLVMNAPWSPALGLLGNILFFLCYQEKNFILKILGIISTIGLIIGSGSRAAILCLLFVFTIFFLIDKIFTTYFLFVSGVLSFIFSIFYEIIITAVYDFIRGVRDLRKGSSNTRDKLEQMALNDWWNEAFMWGHGTFLERGFALVNNIPTGSHHMWYGLLYLHGIVGAVAFAFALIWSFWSLIIKVGVSQYAPLGISFLCILFIFSFSENIESLAYLYWPALVMLGIIFKETDVFKKA